MSEVHKFQPVSFRDVVTFYGDVTFKDVGSVTFEAGGTFGALTIDGALTVTGATQLNNTLTVGVDDTGKDVKLFGATSGSYMLWDESGDQSGDQSGELLGIQLKLIQVLYSPT